MPTVELVIRPEGSGSKASARWVTNLQHEHPTYFHFPLLPFSLTLRSERATSILLHVVRELPAAIFRT